MNTKYYDLINQTFYFPQEEFTLNKDHLQFHNIDLMKLVEQYGTPLKFTYLPQISNNINKLDLVSTHEPPSVAAGCLLLVVNMYS